MELDCLIISLMCVLSNTAQLLGPQASTTLALRLDAEYIISTIAKALIKDMPLYEKGKRRTLACYCCDFYVKMNM